MLLSSSLNAQNTGYESYLLKSDAPDFNTFRSNSQLLEQLEYFSEKIYPQGRILLDITKSDEFNIDDIPQLLGADANSTFVLESRHPSLLKPGSNYYIFQQYHEGIIVDGGGYTILRAPWETDPCASVEFISPAINSHIQVPTDPTIGENELSDILNIENIENVSISITNNLLQKGNYNLTWQGHYHEEGVNMKFWVDAHSGEVIKTVSTDDHLLAPMEYENYPAQLLDDSQNPDGTITFLESEDGRLRTIDGGNVTTISINLLNTLPTPSTTSGSWFDAGIPARVFQAHHTASEALRISDELEFGIENAIILSASSQDAFAIDSGSPEDNFVAIGATGGPSSPTIAAYDIMAHEISHGFLNTFFDNINIANSSVEEAIADMFGAYIESRIESNPIGSNSTWVMGDDNPSLEARANRDLSNPIYSTFEEVKDFDEEHNRSVPLGHWFFLISEGAVAIPASGFEEIPGLGIEEAILIVTDAVVSLNNPDADYPEFRESVIATTSNVFGYCSDQTTAVIRAFDRIGVGSDGTCNYRVYEAPYYCEEEGFVLCVEQAADEFEFEWFFPNSWVVKGAGNTGRIEGRCLYVTSFSTYNYYPITRTVTLRNHTANIPDLVVDIIIADCDGDDPICQEVNPGAANVYENDSPRNLASDNNIEYIKVYNIMGELIFTGNQISFFDSGNSQKGLLIISSFNSNNQIIKSEKIVILD